MQFPRINQNSGAGADLEPSGLAAFYARAGVKGPAVQQGPRNSVSLGIDAQNNARGFIRGSIGTPSMQDWKVLPQSQMGAFPHIAPTMGAPGAPVGPSAPSPAFAYQPSMSSMINMQAQMMQKRRANIALKVRAVSMQQQHMRQQHMQQQYMQQQHHEDQGLGEEPVMGMRPLQLGIRDNPSQQRQQQNMGESKPEYLQPRPPKLEPPQDPQSAFDLGQKLAQMEQFMKEAKAKEEREAEEMEEHNQHNKERTKSQKNREKPLDKKGKSEEEELGPEEISLLDKLEREARERIAEGEKALREISMSDEELRMAADAAGKQEMKDKFKSRLENLRRGVRSKLPIQPLWRHIQDGNPKPPKERILCGKALFRACAWGIVVMFVRPNLAIRKRKLFYKEKEVAEFRRTLDAFADACMLWWGTLIKIPVASFQEGNIPLLRPKKRNAFSKTTIVPELLTALKVRVRGVVKALKNSRMPPEYITSFLITLIEDDNYFYDGFLYPEEVQIIELNDFGGSRGMVRELPPEDRDMQKPCKKGQIILGSNSAKRRKVDASRARLLIQNFVFIRIIINKCVLTPWHARIARKPKNTQLKVLVDNLRVLATILYMVLRECNKKLPDIIPNLEERYADKLDPEKGEHDENGEEEDEEASNSKQDKEVGNGDKEDKDDVNGNPNDAKALLDSVGEYKDGTIMYYLFGPRLTGDAAGNRGRRGAEDLLREDLAFNIGKPYSSLQHTVGCLINLSEFDEIRSEIESWLPELAADVDDYTDRLLFHVLESRTNVLHDDFHELVDGHEDAPDGEITVEEATARLEAKVTARREEKDAKEQRKQQGGNDGNSTSRKEGGAGTGRKNSNTRIAGDVKVSNKPLVEKLDLKGAGLVPATARSQR